MTTRASRHASVALTVLLWPLVLPPGATAQANVNYQFVNTIRGDDGARSARMMGIAGAGIGMADDASAALFNPAALRLLVHGEVAVDALFAGLSVPLVASGQLVRPGLGGVPIASVALQMQDRRLRGTDPFTSVGFAYPAGRFAVSGYLRVVGNQEAAPHVFNEAPAGASNTFVLVEAPAVGVDERRVEFGFASAYSVRRGLSVGAAVALEDTDVSGGFFSISQTVQQTIRSEEVRLTSKMKFTPSYTIGGLWSPTSRVNIGAAFHKGSAEDHTVTRTVTLGAGTIADERPTTFRVPDWTGVGMGFRITETLRVAADVRRVAYSQQKQFLVDAMLGAPGDYELQDGTELRAGTEYVVPLKRTAVALRGGVWEEPAHSLRFMGNDPLAGPLLHELFAERIGRRVHGTAGAGLSVGRFELNVGADLASRYRRVGASTVIRFK
jgi:long-chain fatty acid transport protein